MQLQQLPATAATAAATAACSSSSSSCIINDFETKMRNDLTQLGLLQAQSPRLDSSYGSQNSSSLAGGFFTR